MILLLEEVDHGRENSASCCLTCGTGCCTSKALYIKGSPLGDDYKPKKEAQVTYRFSLQRRNVKTTSGSALVKARFDGRLEATVGPRLK